MNRIVFGCAILCCQLMLADGLLFQAQAVTINRVLGFTFQDPAAPTVTVDTKLKEPPGLSGDNVIVTAELPGGTGDKTLLMRFSTVPGSPVVEISRTGGPMPDGSSTVARIGSEGWGISGSNFAWVDRRLSTNNESLWANLGGTTQLVAEVGVTSLPGSSGDLFRSIQSGDPISIDGTNLAFEGNGTTAGIYALLAGTLSTVVASADVSPNGSTFSGGAFDEPSISGSDVVFEARTHGGAVQGIFGKIGGTMITVASTDTTVPGHSTNFTFLNNPEFDTGDGSVVVFEGSGPPGADEGLYRTRVSSAGATELTKIVGTGDPVPGHPGQTFTVVSEGGSSEGGALIAFLGSWGPGWPNHNDGVFVWSKGVFVKLADTTEVLDGKDVAYLDFQPAGLDGRRVVFAPEFSDGSRAIYVANVPDPMSSSGSAVNTILSNPATPAAAVPPLSAAKGRIDRARAKLAATPSDPVGALAQLRQGVAKLQKSLRNGAPGAATNASMSGLVSFAREIASGAIADAIARGGRAAKISRAQSLLAEGEGLVASGTYDRGVARFKVALQRALSA